MTYIPMINKLHAMTDGGHKLAEVRRQLVAMVAPGVQLIDIDRMAEKLLLQSGGEPAFKRVKDYQWSTCINVNSGVVHGIPNHYTIKSGDTIAIDVGLYYQGYNTDTSITVGAGQLTNGQQLFLETGRRALHAALQVIKPGKHIWHISATIQQIIESAGYHPTIDLTGHGVGKLLHERPNIPCIAWGQPEKSPVIQVGQTLAIEVIYMMGSPEIVTQADGWTISTRDGKMAGLFEETIAVTDQGALVLTK